MNARLLTAEGITALQSGQGADLVVLHSLLTDRSAFDAVLPSLEQRFRVTRINLPGYHGSAAVAPDVDSLVDFVRRAWDMAEVGAGATLLGNGLGGTLALAFALEESQLLGELVLCDAVAGFPPAGREPFRVMAARVAEAGMGAIAEIAARRVFHERYLSEHPEAIEERRQVLLQADPQAFRALCSFLAQADLTPQLEGLRVPTRVLCGELDLATPPAVARIVADRVAGATYTELPGCGHCPPLEQPHAFLSTFLKKDQ